MAQTGYTPIQLYRTTTASATPTAGNLTDGELAINTTDEKLYFKNASGTVKLLAANVMPIANGGTGATTASVALTNLGAVAKAGDTMTGVLAFTAGTVSAPGITFSGDTNTGIFSPAADTIAFTEGGVESMRIDSSGNVGIGTSSPGAKLAVQNDRAATALSQVWSVYNGASFENDVTLAYTGSVTNFGNFQSNPLAFLTNNTERMRIDSSGNVGIGTSSPSTLAKLVVAGADDANLFGLSSTTGVLRAVAYRTSSAGAVVEATNAAQSAYANLFLNGLNLLLGTGGSERLRIDSSGNVGIGTSSPGSKLEVNQGILTVNTSDQSLTRLQLKNTGAGGRTWDLVGGLPGVNNSQFSVYDVTAAATRLTIDSSGNVGIGTSSPNSLLELNKASGASDIRLSVAGTLYGTAYASSSDMTINSVTAIPLKLGTNNTERFQIGSSGQLGIGGANYGTSGQVLTSNGSGSAPSWQAAGGSTGALKNVQVFTSSGTYTRTSGVTTAVVVAVGGGGGGKGATALGGGGNGGNGGTTSFGSHVTAAGGTGATGYGGGAGGTGGTGATIAIKGQGGGAGGPFFSGVGFGGQGGGQGGGQAVSNATGVAGVRGGGGSGAGVYAPCAGENGNGGGGQGETCIKYSTTVGATETVTIGAGGTAGTNGGGAGGAGYIIVYEYS